MWNVFSIESEFFRFELEIWFIEMSRTWKVSGKTHPGNFKRISEWILYIHSDVHI